MPRIEPVDYDPFQKAPPTMEAVDYDPFAKTDVTQTPTQQLAPASGAFPAVMSGGGPSAVLPQSSTTVTAPPPSDTPPAPAQDPGIMAESYGNMVKGLHSVKRGAFLTGYMLNMYDDVDNIANHLAASQDIERAYPSSASTRKANEELEALKDSGAGGFLPALGVYADHPKAALGVTLQSLPTMLPSLATVPVGTAAGSLLGPGGAVAGGLIGMGLGSGSADFGNTMEEYARDKWKPQNAADWKAFLLDPARRDEAAIFAAKHAGMVGTFDMAGGKLGGKVGMAVAGGLGEFAGRGIGGKVARGAVAGVPALATEAGTGAAGEAAGELASAGKIDPTQVAGELVGGFVGGAGGAAIEPVVHTFNIGGGKQTPATPADVAGLGAAMNVPTQDQISGTMSVRGNEPAFFSPLRRYIEDKGPGSANADQWLGTLKNAPGVKEEEIADLGLHDFIGAREGKITKREMLDHLDENAIQIDETQRFGKETVNPRQTAILAEVQAIRDRDPTAVLQGGATNGEHPQVAPLIQEYFDLQEKARAKYEQYTLPGERGGYTELNLHLPTRNVEGDNTQRDYVGGHYQEPNTIVHARVTDRVAPDGTPFALIEEIQSDWHQAGRKYGYKTPVTLTNPRLVDATNYKYEFDGSDGRTHYGWAARVPQGWDNTDGTVPSFNPAHATEAQRIARAMESAQDYHRGNRGAIGLAQGPFKKSWDELAFKRLLRWAADKGYKRVAWVNAAEQMRRYPGGGEAAQRLQGMTQFYDRIVPSIAKKWAKRLGGTMGETIVHSRKPDTTYDVMTDNGNLAAMGVTTLEEAQRLAQQIRGTFQMAPDYNTEQVVQHIDLPQAAVDLIQRGLPMYSKQAENRRGGATLDELAGGNPIINAFGKDLATAFDGLIKQFNFPFKVELVFHEGPIRVKEPNGRSRIFRNALGMADFWVGNPSYPVRVHISPQLHKNAAEVWATMTHELGHIVDRFLFANASTSVRTSVMAAFNEWRANRPVTENMRKLIQARDNAVIAYYNTRNFNETRTRADFTNPSERQYWVEFEEWFAEQVARWATSSEKPLSTVEKFFKHLAETLKDIYKAAAAKFGLSFEPTKAMSDWLNTFHKTAPFAQDIATTTTVETTVENAPHMGPEEPPVERQPETTAPREAIDKLFEGRPPKEVKVAAAYADKFNKIYKWMLGVHQVAQRNAHIVPLQEYTETIAVAGLVKQQIMIRAQEVLKKWNKLGGRQGDAVAAMLDEIQRMEYRTPDEVKRKVARLPTQTEIEAIGRRHGVTQEGYAVAREIATTFQEHLTRYEAVLRAEAGKITDAVKQTKAMDAITKHMKDLRSKPYFPAMRFGDYTITVRDAANHVIHFETFEYERTRNNAADAIRQQYGVTRDQMQLGKLNREVKPLMGVPTQLLDLMGAKLDLTKKQRDALEQLKFEMSPAQSFKHRFQHKRRIAGYSQDFRRAYANYFFHGANHLMKTMYADRLRGLVKATKDETKAVYDVTTRHEIVAYMDDHLNNWLDPKSDWAALRSIAFLWSLAWTPAAAAQNLTQTLMTTYPFLAQHFGDFKAVGAMTRAGVDFTTFYKKGTMAGMTDFELKVISRLMAEGKINEAMAPELAGFAEGRTLGIGFGGNELQRGIHTFNEWGAKMFELAEQTNRRLVARAATKLAMENPGAKYVKAMVIKHRLAYDQARKEGWTEAQAATYVAALDSVNETQFQYGREYSPRMFRGKVRSVFVFKTFIQSYVLFLANYPQAAVRSLLIMGFLGGLMGVPGGDDLREILKAIGWQIFGKNFDIEKEARRMIIQMLGEDEFGRNAADQILHGVARKGFGIPAVMDMLGGTVGVDIPMPVFDRSKSISAGTLLPVELGKLFGPPVQDADAIISAQTQKASGAVFGAGFNIYKSLVNTKLDWSDSKRWERAVPRAIGSLAKAYRVGTEGRERNVAGATVVNYDVRDTQQLAEVLGIAAGYSPYRQALQWDRIMAGQEATKLYDIRRQVLMKQMGNAVLGKDPKEVERVKGAIQNFNTGLPTEARGKAISGDTLRQSVGSQARSRQAQEAELSVKKSDIPILREVQKLYPASQATSVRRVPRSLQ